MSVIDISTYGWLSDSELEEAGCVTVVPQADLETVAGVFGHDGVADRDTGATRFADRSAAGELGDHGDEVWVSATADAAVVFEFNGFEGARDEVLREASRAGTTKVAASLSWSINGAIQMTCARRGKVVASVDLSDLEDEDLAQVPRPLRPLARRCVGENGADPLAVGAAMIETYTGVGFTRADLDGAVARRIVASPSDLTTYESRSGRRMIGPLEDAVPELADSLARMAAPDLRRLAEWAALAAVREAGLAEDVTVRAVTDQFGTGAPTSLPPALEALRRRLAAENDRLRREEDEYDEPSFGALAPLHASLPVHAVHSLRYTSHTDAFSAAVGALSHAASAYSSTRLDRAAHFDEDDRGRRLRTFDPPPRLARFVEVLRQLLTTEPERWADLATELPTPLTVDELASAVEVDRRLQEAGAFDTWQVLGPASVLSLELGDSEPLAVEREAEVLARYQELERRDEAIKARRPIAVEVLTPQIPGGFAIALSDGLRVERLPAGRAAGRLYLTFVFTDELGSDPWGSSGRRGTGPHDRVVYSGPDGPIHGVNGSGSTSKTFVHWQSQLDIADRPWIRLGYLDGGKVVASETIELA